LQRSSSLLDRVAKFMAAVGPERKPGVIAVSGGPDSVALLRLFVELRQNGDLIVAHLNHRLRGPDSDADEDFVQNLAKEFALPFHSKRADVAELARSRGENLENAARQVRYDWFTEIAASVGAGWVATGHTADDQAETVLHRLLRGSGLQGLSGIPPRRELAPGVDLIRPLLGESRAEVLAYLVDNKQEFRSDASNLDLAFTRNRIRRELLPVLAKDYNPAIVSVVGRLAEQARAVQTLLIGQASDLLGKAEWPRAGNLLVFQRSELAEAPRHLVREMFRLVWSRESWPAGAMTFNDWERVAALVHQEDDIDLPERIHARSKGVAIQVGPIPKLRKS
jgi:tRNA(Ile)-lysidine synthase